MTDILDSASGTPGAVTGTAFTALMLVEGLESADGRMFELGTTTWRDLPLPFMVRDTAIHGPGEVPAPSWAAGQIESIERDPTDASRIIARGHLMPNGDGARAEELARHSFRGVSIDGYGDSPVPPDQQVTAVDQTGAPAAVLTRYADTVISGLTMVPTPALPCCMLWFDDEEPPAAAQMAHGGAIDPDAAPEVVLIPNAFEQLVASAGGPVNPPRAWFFTPEPDEYRPLEVTADGRISGHIARAGQCHIANKGRCDTAPMSTTVPPYKSFHRTIAQCADGSEVACGWLTVDAKHDWNFQHTPEQTADYYDHTGTLAAKIRLSNGRHGVWASGTLLPGLDDRTLAILQGPEVSGDWRVWTDPDTNRQHGLEVQGVLAVPCPGFPGTRTRPELLVASGGEVRAQVGFVDPDDCGCNDEESDEMDDLEAMVASGDAGAGVATQNVVATVAGPIGQARDQYADALIASMDDPIIELSVQERARWFAKYNADDRKKMAKDGSAMPDGSFPIADVEDLKSAIRAVGRAGADHDAVRRHIVRRAKALGKSALIPSNWGDDGSLKS